MISPSSLARLSNGPHASSISSYMHSASYSRYSGCDAQCIAFARWFHAHGIAWRGTPSELISELSSSTVGPTHAVFSDTRELLAFLELNSQALLELGVEQFIDKCVGRPTRITLRSTLVEAEENELDRAQDNAELLSSQDNGGQGIVGLESPTSLESDGASNPDNAETALDNLSEAAPEEESSYFNIAGEEQPSDEVSEFLAADEANRRKAHARVRRFILAALLSLVLGASVFAGWKYRNEMLAKLRSPEVFANLHGNQILAQLKTAEGAIVTKTSVIRSRWQDSHLLAKRSNRDESSDRHHGSTADTGAANLNQTDVASSQPQDLSFDELVRQASETTAPSPQEELGVRYAEGRGVQRDRVAAYTWLVLAHSNGGGNDDLLRKLNGEMSQTELQKVRIAIGNSYAQGIGVPKDLVIAHSWFTLAEVAGSADATLMKKDLENSMTPEQIKQGENRATDWLSRHSNRATESSNLARQ
jgi:TPR repeat protein